MFVVVVVADSESIRDSCVGHRGGCGLQRRPQQPPETPRDGCGDEATIGAVVVVVAWR